MATIDRPTRRSLLRTAPLLIAGLLAGCGSPSIGSSPGAFKAVDALYTAVSLRENVHLDRCEGILRDLRSKGELPESAATFLDGIVAEARSGQWEAAQGRLGKFMRAQRRQPS